MIKEDLRNTATERPVVGQCVFIVLHLYELERKSEQPKVPLINADANLIKTFHSSKHRDTMCDIDLPLFTFWILPKNGCQISGYH